ncbi:MAG: GNAT family N-acetyltransferase [Pseudomonadota bacterium]|nr:GNAT family N-acetyltransferase [Pseudomonadota bacterium]
MQIVTYDPRYRSDFERLNRAWLETYFRPEPADEKLFRDPQAMILKPGGEIFFAIDDERAVGTCALIPHGPNVYELAKMGVDPTAQGRGIGAALLDAALAWACSHAASKVVLMSSRKLETALRLYRRFGFVETPLPEALLGAYSRCDVYMELPLAEGSGPG